jgi:hypothetical protein
VGRPTACRSLEDEDVRVTVVPELTERAFSYQLSRI